MKPQTSSASRNSGAKKQTGVESIQPKSNAQSTVPLETKKPINLKQFKIQIDHQIAKCLDTLDRQGLKYLRQTLKNSYIFDQEIKEIIEKEDNQPKKTKKDTKNNKQTKQIKPHKNTKEIIETKQIKSNKDKKMSKGNQKQNSTSKQKKQQIEQQIIQEYETFLDDNQQPAKQKTKLGPNPTYPLKQQKSIPLKLQKFQENLQEPIKPFAKRGMSRQGSRQQNRQTAQELQTIPTKQKIINKYQQQDPNKKQIFKIVEKINQLPQQKLRKVGKFLQMLQQSQRIQQQQLAGLNSTKPYLLKQEQVITVSNPSTMKSALSKNNKKNQKATSLYSSIIKGNKKNSPQVEKQVNAQFVQLSTQQIKDDNQINQQISEIQVQNQINEPKIMQIHSKIMLKSDFKEPKQSKQPFIEQNQQQIVNQIIMTKRTGSQIIKKGSFIKNLPTIYIKKPLDIQVTQSHQADTLQLNQANPSKMVRLGGKKLGTNKIKIVLLRNRGHPSIIGLTCIQFYNTASKIITITTQNIKTPTPKLLRLFNGVCNTTNEQQMFTTAFKRDYQIQLQISQKIGGLRIWNYNKSQIQSVKQTDWIQLYINDKLSWEGLIKKGSYNQIVEYSTEAIVEQGFDFSKIKKQGDTQTKILQQNEGPSSGELKIDSTNLGGLNISAKPKQNKADWLQNTLMQDKIKKILQQNQSKDNQFQIKRSVNRLPNRFSQIYQQQQNYKSVFKDTKQKFNPNSVNNKRQSVIRETPIEHISNERHIQSINKLQKANNQQRNRTNSQKIDDQKDIFSSFGQSLIKQKIRANQIYAKANQMAQKIEKIKDNYKKQEGLGYSSLINKQQTIQIKQTKHQHKIQVKLQKKQKKDYEKQLLDDFMNDSLFQDQTTKKQKKANNPHKQSEKQLTKKTQQIQKIINNNNNNKKVDIDDFLNQLNDLVGTKQNRYQYGNQKQKTITIPELPKGNKIQIILVSNWGDQQFIGLNKIQFFDNQGQRVFPSQAKSNIQGSSVVSIFSQSNGYITEQPNQWKCQKREQIKLDLIFNKKIQLSLIRLWNYIGDRVHSMIGVRKIHVSLDGSIIFMGDIRKNGGSYRDQILKSCESILFTNNATIHKRIAQNDWLSQQIQNQKHQAVLFKKTSQNFMRPLTNGLNDRQLKIAQNKQGFKLPKRNCFQYDPPNLPSGYYIKLILHKTWGDRDFIGLNGIVIFDQKGKQINSIQKISQFPAPLITLSGYQEDKRILKNLFNGQNLTSKDESIWLAPYLMDIDKMQKQAQNAILIQFDKLCTFSAINVYNYVKTPQRGIRQIEIHIDNYLAYRGYVKRANYETGQIMTTINFTKDPAILQKLGYAGYNEDNLGQQVSFYNEGKPQKPLF